MEVPSLLRGCLLRSRQPLRDPTGPLYPGHSWYVQVARRWASPPAAAAGASLFLGGGLGRFEHRRHRKEQARGDEVGREAPVYPVLNGPVEGQHDEGHGAVVERGDGQEPGAKVVELRDERPVRFLIGDKKRPQMPSQNTGGFVDKAAGEEAHEVSRVESVPQRRHGEG